MPKISHFLLNLTDINERTDGQMVGQMVGQTDGHTDGQTDGRTDISNYRVASLLKKVKKGNK